MAHLDPRDYVSTDGAGLTVQTGKIVDLVLGTVVGATFSAAISVVLGVGDAFVAGLVTIPRLAAAGLDVALGILSLVLRQAAAISARATGRYGLLAYVVSVVVVAVTIYVVAIGVMILVE